jgi:hypothetical protein
VLYGANQRYYGANILYGVDEPETHTWGGTIKVLLNLWRNLARPQVVPAAIVLGIFAVAYGWLVASVLFPIFPKPSWPTDDVYRTIFILVANVVGGIVAVGFGLKPAQVKVRDQINDMFGSRANLTRSLLGLGDALTAGMTPSRGECQGTAIAFAVVYFLVGLVGLLAWKRLADMEKASDLLAVLGGFEKVWLAVVAAMVIGMFRDPDKFQLSDR